MHHTINIMLSHQKPMMMNQVHDLAIASYYSFNHACCYSRTLVGSFQGVKTILRYTYLFCSETPMLLVFKRS